MFTADWFFAPPDHNPFNMSERLRRSFWGQGFGNVWAECTRAQRPFHATGHWEGDPFEIEWEPGQWLKLRTEKDSQAILDGFSRLLRSRPIAHTEDETGRAVIEWRPTSAESRVRFLQGSMEFKTRKHVPHQ